MRFAVALMLGLTLAGAVAARAPEQSTRPVARGETVVAADAAEAPAAGPERRPRLRPAEMSGTLAEARLAQELKAAGVPGFVPETAALSIARAQAFATRSPQAIGASLRPFLRPPAVVQKAMAKRREARRGAVCGDISIQGEALGYVPGRIGGCGIQKAVRLRSVAGVGFTQQPVMDCRTAGALKTWINRSLKPAVGQRGGGVARIRVAAHYACRTRNNQRGAKISEHGKGRAIDISGFTLRNGGEVTVLGGWGTSRDGPMLRRVHSDACGIFGTVLGPGSDGYHADHLHFDTARYRGGAYCR
ncbi:extensin family protein [Salipiger mucosus]|uniref:Extensin-like protein n=1 Tax=Salipiger mucosus DSM 16094 TaxID=1123237 RepID=S9QT55_9RHOB|nr:extensin family protein [Salipiger mucosus]EPX82802.1 extensin-like protein [Salipiger mucosus DSM 16094]